ncbi:unnamed protein product [Chrysoparadoxa australica]
MIFFRGRLVAPFLALVLPLLTLYRPVASRGLSMLISHTRALPLARSMANPAAKKPRQATEANIEEPEPAVLATLRIKCPDSRGIVAGVAQVLCGYNVNILQSDQFTDRQTDMYFQRLRVDLSEMHAGLGNKAVLENGLAELAKKYSMEWQISYDSQPKTIALMVSKDSHCLYDILIRHKEGELPCNVAVVVSNHEVLKPVADAFGVPFRYMPIPTKAEGGKRAQEIQVEALLEEMKVDLIVLARYMQILTPEWCDKNWSRTLNIHHSFLPAFVGSKPYHQAHSRGVKIIGATAHFATTELDAGPIVEQQVCTITHSDSVKDMIRKGRDLERVVLARAVRWFIADAILVHGNKTVVFDV